MSKVNVDKVAVERQVQQLKKLSENLTAIKKDISGINLTFKSGNMSSADDSLRMAISYIDTYVNLINNALNFVLTTDSNATTAVENTDSWVS